MLAAPLLPTGEETAPKVKAAKVERFWGKIRWFRGTVGFVTSAKVKTGRTVNPSYRLGIEVQHAIFLHKNDCQDFTPSFGMDVHFRLGSDEKGNSKAFDVTDRMMTVDEHRKQSKATNAAQSTQEGSVPGTQKAVKIQKDISIASKDDPQLANWMKARMSQPNPLCKNGRADFISTAPSKKKGVQPELNARNLELHSCGSSTAPGSSANSVASELDVHSQASVQAGRPKVTLADRPRYMHSSIATSLACVSRHQEVVELTKASRHLEIVEPDEERASDPITKSWVPENWDDDVPEELCTEELHTEAASDQHSVAESCEELSEEEVWDQSPVAAPVAQNWEADEVPGCWCPKRPRQKLENKKLAKPKTAPQNGQLCKFCEAMGPEFPFEFVARHLGTDFDAIVQSASDVHSLDSLVRAGMKPLHRNKFCRALRHEMEQRVMRREAPKQELADFLAKIGLEFNSAFVANNLGTNDLDEIIMRFTDLNDLDVLVVAGMKPLFRNKLHRQLALERKRRAAEC
jgi:hypothetical protein